MQPNETSVHPLQRWQESIWLLIALLTPLFVNLWVEQQFEASKIWLLRTLIWVLALAWLAGRLRGLRVKPLSSALGNLIIALVLVLILSTLLSTSRTVAFHGTLERSAGLLTQLSYLLLFLCVATRIDARSSRQLLHVIVFTAVPICLLGLAQAMGWQPLPLFTDARSPMTTTLGRANFTGAYLALLLPLTLAAVWLATGRRLRFAYAALVALEGVVIALTQARAAWIAAVVGVSVLLWLRAAPAWSPRLCWASVLGGVGVLSATLLLILQRGIANGGSIAARWTIWQAALRLLWPRLWLGYGADTLELHFPSVYPPPLVYYQGRGVVVDRAHNWLLDWSLNYGVVATLLLIGIVWLILRQGWRQLTDSAAPGALASAGQYLDARWLAACMAAVCAQLAGNLFLFEVAATSVVFWLLLGVLAAATSDPATETTPTAMPHWAHGVLLAGSVLIVGWAVWQFNARPLLADVHSWRGTHFISQGNHAAALSAYLTAARYQPHRGAYRVAAALTAAQLTDYEQAEESMHEAITLRPTDPVLVTQLAAIYASQANGAPEKLDLAYGAYERAIVLAPTMAATYRQYADLALRSGNSALAAKQAQRAVDLDATDGLAYGILGWTWLQIDDLPAAQGAFEQAVTWQPDSADFFLGLALAHFEQGRPDSAREALQQSLALDPSYAPSLTLQVQLERQ